MDAYLLCMLMLTLSQNGMLCRAESPEKWLEIKVGRYFEMQCLSIFFFKLNFRNLMFIVTLFYCKHIRGYHKLASSAMYICVN